MQPRPKTWLVSGLLFFFFFGLYGFAPKGLSDDSLAYLSGIVKGEQLLHPHHLMLMPTMVVFKKAFAGLGITGSKAAAVLLVSRLAAALGVVMVFRIGLMLGFGFRSAFCGAIITGLSGTLWQFAGQTECYAFLFAMLTLLVAAVVWAAKATSTRVLFARVVFVAAPMLAYATTLHQTVAFIALALALALWLLADMHSKAMRTAAVFSMLGVAGVLSLATYVYSWKIQHTGTSFVQWLTMYTQMNSDWGNKSSLSFKGLETLLRGWGGLWFNMDPDHFYAAPPADYRWLSVLWLGLLVGSAVTVALSPAYRRNLLWLLTWLLLHEAFMLWWTPWLRSMQTLTLIPQGLLIGMGLQCLASRKGGRGYVIAGIAAMMGLVLLAANWAKMVAPGLSGRQSATAEVEPMLPFANEKDLILTDIRKSMIFNALTPYKAAIMESDWKDSLWASPAAEKQQQGKRVIIDGALFIDETLIYNPQRLDNYYKKAFDKISASAGGTDKLKGEVVFNRYGMPLALVLGLEGLPKSYDETMSQLATGLPSRFSQVAAFVSRQLPTSFKEGPLRARQKEAGDQPKSVSLLDGKWTVGNDIVALGQGDGLQFTSSQRDPSIIKNFQPPLDVGLYSTLTITATVLPADAGAVSNDDWKWELFFKFADKPWDPAGNMFLLDWPHDGREHTVTVKLWDYPFLTVGDKLEMLRLDTGNIPNCKVAIKKLELQF